MHIINNFSFKLIMLISLCFCLVFLPGFTCQSLEDDLLWESFVWSILNESKTYFLTVSPNTVIIPQGQSATLTLDFSSRTNEIPENFSYYFDPDDDPVISAIDPEPTASGTFRTRYSIQTNGTAPGIYRIVVAAVDVLFGSPYVLDHSTLTVVIVPTGISSIPGATQIAAGDYHSLAILEDGSVWSWGFNDFGQLGDGTTSDRLSPVKVQGLPVAAVAIAAGRGYSLALLADGTVWGWGDNENYQLSPNWEHNLNAYVVPVQLWCYGERCRQPGNDPIYEGNGPIQNVIAIAAGEKHSMLLTSDGVVSTCGTNAAGQLGRFSTHESYDYAREIDIPNRITSIAAGKDFSLALDETGRLWGWGDNNSGQLGDDILRQYNRPVEMLHFQGVQTMAAGSNHAIALMTDGTVRTAGGNSYGQLGVEEKTGPLAVTVPGISSIEAIDAGFAYCLALDSDGKLYGWGDNSFGQLSILEPLSGSANSSKGLIRTLADVVVDGIAAGGRHSLAMVTGCPSLLAWGDNSAGQLGDGTGASSVEPVQVDGIGENGSEAPCELPLSIIIVGKGKVTSNPSGIDCDKTCGKSFAPDTLVSLTAEPEFGWSFSGWAGDAAGSNPTTSVLIDGSKNCIAYFSSEPIPPTARFTSSPSAPLTTDTVILDASGSSDNGLIVKYEWDFDEDGVFDLFRNRTSVYAVFSAQFVTQFWTAGTHTVRLRVTDDDGMTDETTGEIVVRAPERPEHDLGDAPDSSNTVSGVQMLAYPQSSVVAHYPTVYRTGSPPYGPIHHRPHEYFYLGKSVTLENEADVGVDEDAVNNINLATDSSDHDGGDDGIQMPTVLPNCGRANMECTITVVDPPHQYIYVNVWFDWNRDGDWDDILECPDGSKVPEWGVKNEEQYLYDSGTETLRFSFKCWHPSEAAVSDPMWMRVTLSEQEWSGGSSAAGGSGPTGGYEYGETEDYLINPSQ